jgi:flagellar motor switch protein FliM
MDTAMSDAAINEPVPSRPREARIFDFRRPNKLNRDHVRNLQIVNETFARQFTTVLSSTLRAIAHMNLKSIEQLTYDEYVRSTPNPTYMAMLSTSPLVGVSVFQCPLRIALTAIDFLLGGKGKGVPERVLTEIELGLMRSLLDRALAELAYAFHSVVEIEPGVVRYESNPQFAQIAAPSDMMIVVTFSLKIENEEGDATLCFPFSTLQPVLEDLTGNLAQVLPAGVEPAHETAKLETAVLGVPVEFRAEFPAVHLTADDIIALRAGEVIPFDLPTDQPIVGVVGGVPTFSVRPARKGKRFACQILSTLPGAERAIADLTRPNS